MSTFTKCYNWRNKKLNSNSKAAIEIRISKCKDRKYIPTGYLIEKSYWDEKKHEVKKTHPQAAQINARLNQIIYEYEQKETELISTGKPYSLDDLCKQDTARQTFADFCNNVSIEQRRKNVSDKHKSLFRLVINEVLTLKKAKNFTIKDIDISFLYKYQNQLKERNLNSKTINKRLQVLAMFIHDAVSTGVMKPSENPYLDFKYLKEVDTERAIPTPEEVERLENLDLAYNPELQQVRDMFIFNCYMGLRNGDLFNLKYENLITENGDTVLHFTESKTNKPQYRNVSVMFNGKGLKILTIYKGVDSVYLFPTLSDKKIRDGVVMLSNIIKARTPFTFYGSRHYCISYLASHGVPANEVQRFANHSDLRTTQQYFHSLSLDKHIREAFTEK